RGHNKAVFSSAFNRDGRRLVSGSGNAQGGEVRIWEVTVNQSSHSIPRTFRDPALFTRSVAFSPDGKLLASASVGRAHPNGVRIRGVNSGLERPALKSDVGRVEYCGVAYSPNGKYIAACSYEQIRVWEAQTGIFVHTLTLSKASPQLLAVAFSPDSKHM